MTIFVLKAFFFPHAAFSGMLIYVLGSKTLSLYIRSSVIAGGKKKKNLRNTSSVSNNSFIPPTQWDCSVPAAITINLLFKWIAISNEPSNLLVKIRCLYGLKNHFWELRPRLSKGRRRNHLLNYECWSEDEVQTGSTGKSRTKKKTDLYEELNW